VTRLLCSTRRWRPASTPRSNQVGGRSRTRIACFNARSSVRVAHSPRQLRTFSSAHAERRHDDAAYPAVSPTCPSWRRHRPQISVAIGVYRSIGPAVWASNHWTNASCVSAFTSSGLVAWGSAMTMVSASASYSSVLARPGASHSAGTRARRMPRPDRPGCPGSRCPQW
jgi:hypothetical protein